MGFTGTKSDILWHYTSIDNAVNILVSQKLWATHCRFLNDTSEITIPSKHLLKRLQTKYPDGIGIETLPSDLKCMTQDNLWAFFILSFSGNGDSLPQWREYTPRGGCAIGFDKYVLHEGFSCSKTSLKGYCLFKGSCFNCFYTDMQSNDKFKELDKEFDKLCAKQKAYMEGISPGKPLTNLNIARLCASVKDQSFITEDEYRFLFIHNRDLEKRAIKFYKQRPLIEIELPDIKKCIREIHLSPHETTQETESFFYYLREVLDATFKIYKSKLTYRNTGA